MSVFPYTKATLSVFIGGIILNYFTGKMACLSLHLLYDGLFFVPYRVLYSENYSQQKALRISAIFTS